MKYEEHIKRDFKAGQSIRMLSQRYKVTQKEVKSILGEMVTSLTAEEREKRNEQIRKEHQDGASA